MFPFPDSATLCLSHRTASGRRDTEPRFYPVPCRLSPVAGVVSAVGRTVIVSLPVRNILADTSLCCLLQRAGGRVWAPLRGAALSRGPAWALCVLGVSDRGGWPAPVHLHTCSLTAGQQSCQTDCSISALRVAQALTLQLVLLALEPCVSLPSHSPLLQPADGEQAGRATPCPRSEECGGVCLALVPVRPAV